MSTFSWVYKQYPFSDPPPPAPPPKVYRPTSWGSKKRVSRNTTFIVQQQKLTSLQSPLCDKWYFWLCIMIYRLKLILYTSKFNLNIYFLCTQRKYVQFHNMKFKMPKSQLLIGLETSFKNRQKAWYWHYLFPIRSVHLVLPPPLAYGLYTCESIANYGKPLIPLNYNNYYLKCSIQPKCQSMCLPLCVASSISIISLSSARGVLWMMEWIVCKMRDNSSWSWKAMMIDVTASLAIL